MTKRDMLRGEVASFNKHFGIKDNPVRRLNSIQECRENLYQQVENLIRTRGKGVNKELADKCKELEKKLEKKEKATSYWYNSFIEISEKCMADNFDLTERLERAEKSVSRWYKFGRIVDTLFAVGFIVFLIIVLFIVIKSW